MPNDTDFNIGAIVALKSHPFLPENENIIVNISGETLHISPLMVIVESVRERKTKFEEQSGLNLADSGTYQCKCMWFSSKSQQFEESWISSKQLKVISKAEDNNQEDLDKSPIEIGGTVTFKTVSFEIAKEKFVTERYSNDSMVEKKKKISSLLSFLSPPMVVIGTGIYEPKEPIIDAKSGNRLRWYSEKLIKCKYYNSHSEKFSEVFMPMVALVKIPKINAEVFQKVSKGRTAIQTIEKTKEGHNRTLIKFGEIIFKGGYYYVEVIDEIYNIKNEVRVDQFDEDIKEYADKSQEYSRYRKVAASKGGKKTTLVSFGSIVDIEKIFKKTKPNVYYRIKYVGANSGEKSTRFISKCSIFETIDLPPRKALVAYCHKRNAERFFLLDQIQEVKIIDLNDKPLPSKPLEKKEEDIK